MTADHGYPPPVKGHRPDLGPFFHTISPDYAIPASAIGGECSDPPPESCSDAGCPSHGDGEAALDYDETEVTT